MADSILRPDSASSVPGNMNAADEVTRRPTTGGGHVATAGSDAAPSNPDATGAGVTQTGPTGGGKAVPDDNALEQSGALGDTGSIDDPGLGADASDPAAPTPTAGHTDAGTDRNPLSGGEDTEASRDAALPTGGLNSGGTIGGTPTGNAAPGLGNEGR